MALTTHFSPGPTLVKHSAAETLRCEILEGRILPGQRIIEGKWATKLGVAQGSIREALNLLAAEGFVEKASGRSARVINLSEADIFQTYELRAAVEGLAARLVTEHKTDLTDIDEIVHAMRDSFARGDFPGLIARDLEFHLTLCQKSGNRVLYEHARRMLIPFFAFVSMRVFATPESAEAWKPGLAEHEQILTVIRLGDPNVSEQYVVRAMRNFADAGYAAWVKQKSEATTTVPSFL